MAAPRIVVVGAGIVGASIAWHLADAGADVSVVDAGAAGGVATPASFAWINATAGNPEPYFRLRVRAMTEWRRLHGRVPGLPLAWCGGLCWDLERPELEAFAGEHGAWGYGIERLDRAGAGRIEPALLNPPDFALHVAGEGAVEPKDATLALLADATARGARLLPRSAVTALVERHGRVAGVEIAPAAGGAERLVADEVVLAAGAATPALAAMAGVELALAAPPGLMAHSRPHSRLLNGLVMAPELHMRQTAEGRIVAATDFAGGDPGADPEAAARAVLETAKGMLRGADALAFDFHTLGYRPTPADGFPVIGRAAATAKGLDGLYIAVMHSGITLAPAVGRFAADEILQGRRDALLAPYGLERFA